MLKTLISRWPFGTFYVLAVLLAAFANYWMFSNAPNVGELLMTAEKSLGLNHFSILVPLSLSLSHPILLPSFLFPAAPTISAIIVSAVHGGNTALRSLFRRLRPVGDGVTAKQGVYLYLAIFGAFAVVLMIEIWWYAGVAGGDLKIALTNLGTHSLPYLVGMVLLASISDTGGLLEELGWRGYAQPLLQKVMTSPLHAALFLGALHAVWHMPRDIPFLMAGEPIDEFLLGQLTYLSGPVGSAVIAAYLLNRSGGSVVPAIVVHGLSNYILSIIPHQAFFSRFGPHEAVRLAIAALIIAMVGKQLGRATEESHS